MQNGAAKLLGMNLKRHNMKKLTVKIKKKPPKLIESTGNCVYSYPNQKSIWKKSSVKTPAFRQCDIMVCV